MSNLNPKIKKITIGLETLREVKVYPLPFAMQLEMVKDSAEAINLIIQLASGTGSSKEVSMDWVTKAIVLIHERLPEMADYSIKEGGREVLNDMDNDQAHEFIMLLYQQNFEALKKMYLKDRTEKIQEAVDSVTQQMSPVKKVH